jgi:hypothetical protein
MFRALRRPTATWPRRVFLPAAVLLLCLVSTTVPAAASAPQPFDPTIQPYVHNLDGRAEAFLNINNSVWHDYQRPDGTWSGWEPLGGAIIGSPTVAMWVGRLHVFVVGTDHQLYVKRQVTPGGGWTPDWTPMGGRLTSNPAALTNGAGLLEVYARGGDNAMWTIWQTWAGVQAVWSTWASIGGGFTDYPRLVEPAYPDPPFDFVTVWATGLDGAFWCDTRQPVTAGRWSGWHRS